MKKKHNVASKKAKHVHKAKLVEEKPKHEVASRETIVKKEFNHNYLLLFIVASVALIALLIIVGVIRQDQAGKVFGDLNLNICSSQFPVTDPDGSNQYSKGTLSFGICKNTTYTDTCVGRCTLKEYDTTKYAAPGYFRIVNCSYGCSNGRCYNAANTNQNPRLAAYCERTGYANPHSFPPVGTVSDLLLNMTFDEQPINTYTVKDYSTYGNDGLLGNQDGLSSPTWTSSGKIGGAYVFDGVDDFIKFNKGFQLDSEFTLVVWVYVNSINDKDGPRILSGSGWPGSRGWDLVYENWPPTAPKYLSFKVSSDCSDQYLVEYSSDIVGQWTHIVGVYVPGDFMKLYVNGELKATEREGIPLTLCPSPNEYIIGGRSPGRGSNIDGMIDEVLIYKKALSASDILKIYQAGIQQNFFVQGEEAPPEVVVEPEVIPGVPPEIPPEATPEVPPVVNQLPTGSITSPVNDEQFNSGDAIPVIVDAFDSDGSVVSVELFADDVSYAVDSESLYEFSVSGLTVGSHIIYAKVYDDKGDIFRTSSLIVRVVEVIPPEVNPTPELE